MVYKLFISFTGKDKTIAENINIQLINAFRGKVKVFISSQSLSPGERWIDKIKESLSKYDGILSLITPNSINKQWIFVEWSAFWLNEKDIFVCLTENSIAEQLIQPIKETQYMIVDKRSDIEAFFKVLSEKTGIKAIPYDQVDDFIVNINRSIESQFENLFEDCLSDTNKFPVKDEKKIELAKYCLNNEKFEYLPKVLGKVRSDYLKTNLANELIDSNELRKIDHVFEFIRSSQNQTEIVISLIDNNFEDINIFKKLINSIYLKDQTQLVNISRYLIQLNRETTNLFNYIIEKIDNMAELRKVAWSLIDFSKHKNELFNNILYKFEKRNRTELRKIGEYLINNANDYDAEVTLILGILKKNNQEQYKILLDFSKQSKISNTYNS